MAFFFTYYLGIEIIPIVIILLTIKTSSLTNTNSDTVSSIFLHSYQASYKKSLPTELLNNIKSQEEPSFYIV